MEEENTEFIGTFHIHLLKEGKYLKVPILSQTIALKDVVLSFIGWLMLVFTRQIKVGDFGLGVKSEEDLRSIAQSASLARGDDLVGTLAYMAPELARTPSFLFCEDSIVRGTQLPFCQIAPFPAWTKTSCSHGWACLPVIPSGQFQKPAYKNWGPVGSPDHDSPRRSFSLITRILSFLRFPVMNDFHSHLSL
jgi:serine/threonine protein kinase